MKSHQQCNHGDPPWVPDLVIRVHQKESGDGTALYYELTASDQGLNLNHRSFGLHPIGRKPEAFFQRFFANIDQFLQLAGREHGRDLMRDLKPKGLDLFEELFPKDLQKELWRIYSRVNTLQFISDEAWIPWELCALQGETQTDQGVMFGEGPFFCQAFSMTRWLPGPQTPRVLPIENMAVLGRKSSDLPQAMAEVRHLLNLSASRKVTELCADLASVKKAMKCGRYDAWHFAGHGNFAHEESSLPCLELNDTRLLTPEHITGDMRNMGRTHPFIFLNACHSSRSGPSLTGMVGWAQKFIKNHAGGFVGAQWAVEDGSAFEFARAFYDHFLAGIPLGESIRLARKRLQHMDDGSWLAYTAFGHPLTRVARETEAAATGRPIALEVKEQPPAPTQELYRDAKSRGSCDRSFLNERMRRFILSHDRGFFLLVAAAGFGKSTWLARLARQKRWPFHFNIRLEAQNDLAAFRNHLACQAGKGADSCQPFSIEDFFSRIPGNPDLDGKRMLLLDGLDEVRSSTRDAGATPLNLPENLPRGCFIIATSRTSYPSWAPRCPRETFEVAMDRAEHLADLRVFLCRGLDPTTTFLAKHGSSHQRVVDALLDAGEGSFLHAAYVLAELDNGIYREYGLAQLPRGLQAYYQDRWRIIRSLDIEGWRNHHLPVLATLTIIRESVPLPLLAKFSGFQVEAVQSVLDAWGPLLFSSRQPGNEGGLLYRLDHDSFKDFLVAKSALAEEGLDLQAAHGRVAEVLWQSFVKRRFALERETK